MSMSYNVQLSNIIRNHHWCRASSTIFKRSQTTTSVILHYSKFPVSLRREIVQPFDLLLLILQISKTSRTETRGELHISRKMFVESTVGQTLDSNQVSNGLYCISKAIMHSRTHHNTSPASGWRIVVLEGSRSTLLLLPRGPSTMNLVLPSMTCHAGPVCRYSDWSRLIGCAWAWGLDLPCVSQLVLIW